MGRRFRPLPHRGRVGTEAELILTVSPAKAGAQPVIMKQPVVYILTNRRNGTLYTGMSTRMSSRYEEHFTPNVNKFVQKYKLDRLVYLETCETIEQAALREKQIKKWYRKWKLELIESLNPEWKDLWDWLI